MADPEGDAKEGACIRGQLLPHLFHELVEKLRGSHEAPAILTGCPETLATSRCPRGYEGSSRGIRVKMVIEKRKCDGPCNLVAPNNIADVQIRSVW